MAAVFFTSVWLVQKQCHQITARISDHSPGGLTGRKFGPKKEKFKMRAALLLCESTLQSSTHFKSIFIIIILAAQYNSDVFLQPASIFTRPAHVSAGAPAGAGWRVSESVLNDSKVIELNAREGVDTKIFSNQFISSRFNITQIQLGSVQFSCWAIVLVQVAT